MTSKIETILPEENGILPNLMDSFKNYETADSVNGRLVWEAEFNHWYTVMRASSMSVADDYLRRFEEAKKKKR